MIMAEHKSNIELTKNIPYLALTVELWGVFGEDFGDIWLRYNGTALYWFRESQIKVCGIS